MDNHLTSLCRGPGKTGAKHEGVETHLEQLHQVFTGQTLCLAAFFKHSTKLSLANSILRAQTLLLTQTHGVVAVCFALGATVLTGSVGALL